MQDKLNKIEEKLDKLIGEFSIFKIETIKDVTKLQVKTGLFWGLFAGVIAFFLRDLLK